MRKQIPILVGEVTADVVSGQDLVLEGYDTSVRYHNGYFDVFKGATEPTAKVEFVKRPAITVQPPFATPALAGTTPRIRNGFVDQDLINADSLYLLWSYTSGATNGVQVTKGSTVMANPAGWENSSVSDMIQLDPNTMSGYRAFVWGVTSAGLVSSAPAFVRITDAEYPGTVSAGTILCAEYLDGYVFVTQGQKIWNCTLNDPTAWTSTDYISATNFPGDIIGLKRLRNYLVAFKRNGIEVFENQGNPTPGSPLGAVRQLSKSIGCWAPTCIKKVSDGIIFIGIDDAGGMAVYKLTEANFELTKISDQYVDSILSTSTQMATVSSFSSPLITQGCFVLPWKGHEFYCFPIQGVGGYTGAGFSLVYDNATQMWVTWSRTNGSDQYPLRGYNCAVRYGGEVFLLPDYYEDSSQMPRRVNENWYQDYGSTAINVYWASPRFNFGTDRRKFMSSMSVFYSTGGQDAASGTGTLSMVYYDDHGSNVTSSRTATLNDATSPNRVVWRRLGSFRERKFLFSHSSNQPLRLKAIEVDVSIAEDGID